MNLENSDSSATDVSVSPAEEQAEQGKKVVRIRKDVLYGIGIAIVLLLAVLAFGRSGNSSSSTDSVVATTISPMEEIATMINNKQYDAGIVKLKEVVASDPRNALAFYNLGVAYQFTNRLAEADANYTLGLEIDNQNPAAYYNRGLVRRDLGRLEDAAADLKIATALKDNWAAAKYNLGQVLISLGKSAEGKKQIEEARAIAPEIGK